MRKRVVSLLYSTFLLSFIFSSCSDSLEEIIPVEEDQNQITSPTKSGSNANVMMQAFYWDVPDDGNWWDVISAKTSSWSSAGFNRIWLPPASKAHNHNGRSMGYNPYDYYDFGEFDQMGAIETRFGSKKELQNLISSAHNNGLEVIADIVINHNSGGGSEANPYTGGNTWTEFKTKSGLFDRSYDNFHPNDIANNDRGSFGGFPDLCHSKSYVQDWLWKKSNSVAKYYKNEMGFDGWRFDFVKGFEPWVVKEWNNSVGGFSVGELWDSNLDYLTWWANEANSSVFDFPCYYAMNDAFDGNDLTKLNNDMMWKRNPYKAVTFVTNHDTDEIWNKMLAYAYILTHEGYPCVFYRDYEEWLDKDKLNNLIWIHNNLASGNTSVLYSDNDEYIARRNGWNGPGIVVYINNADHWQERWIETNWSNTRIKDFTGNSNWEPVTQSGKWVKIQVPPKGYTVWSIK